ncbi:DotU family type IV/VI secretion system protein [Zooshikella ganghwensis]|uniref:DotU family type IV/VI secretion system protein n=1 Tax=Zooshikella ganghwensis TaxID=202772 RepID=UPI0004286905|nr:DotU family type IV/VI secretion system protein [Zooshikella ganghwensis]
MNFECWQSIYTFIIERDKVLTDQQVVKTTSTENLTGAESSANIKASMNTHSIAQDTTTLQIFNQVLSALVACQKSLSRELTEEQVYWIIMALAIHSDEIARNQCSGINPWDWPGLQEKHLNVKAGGSYFYECIDQLIEKRIHFADALDVFYFSLNQGFVGQYHDDDQKKHEYLTLIEDNLDCVIRENPYASVVKFKRVTSKRAQPDLRI